MTIGKLVGASRRFASTVAVVAGSLAIAIAFGQPVGPASLDAVLVSVGRLIAPDRDTSVLCQTLVVARQREFVLHASLKSLGVSSERVRRWGEDLRRLVVATCTDYPSRVAVQNALAHLGSGTAEIIRASQDLFEKQGNPASVAAGNASRVGLALLTATNNAARAYERLCAASSGQARLTLGIEHAKKVRDLSSKAAYDPKARAELLALVEEEIKDRPCPAFDSATLKRNTPSSETVGTFAHCLTSLDALGRDPSSCQAVRTPPAATVSSAALADLAQLVAKVEVRHDTTLAEELDRDPALLIGLGIVCALSGLDECEPLVAISRYVEGHRPSPEPRAVSVYSMAHLMSRGCLVAPKVLSASGEAYLLVGGASEALLGRLEPGSMAAGTPRPPTRLDAISYCSCASTDGAGSLTSCHMDDDRRRMSCLISPTDSTGSPRAACASDLENDQAKLGPTPRLTPAPAASTSR